MTSSQIIRCITVDDEDTSRAIIAKYIEKTDFLSLVGTYSSVAEAVNSLSEKEIDLIFLDIEMPEINGIQYLQTPGHKPQIIFATANKDYAHIAFDYDATDYIVKPVTYLRFMQAINKAKQQLTQQQNKIPENIFVKVNARWVNLNFNEIIYIEANGDYADFYTDSKKLTVHSTMSSLEKNLPPPFFFRVHRSYIVRTGAITAVEDNSLVVQKKIIPIGKSYREQLMRQLNLLGSDNLRTS